MKNVNPVQILLRKIVLLLPFNPRDALCRILIRNAKNLRKDFNLIIILDAAHGRGGNAIVTKYRNPHIRILGFDISLPYVYECRALGVYDDLLIADVRHPPFREKAVDAIYFTETIEHLEKKDGKRALKELERIARKVVLVTTPIGLVLRCNEEVKDGNIYQFHRSGWLPSEFTKRGYKVWGRHPRFLRGRLSVLLYFPPFSLLNLVRLPLEKSFSMVALKAFHE